MTWICCPKPTVVENTCSFGLSSGTPHTYKHTTIFFLLMISEEMPWPGGHLLSGNWELARQTQSRVSLDEIRFNDLRRQWNLREIIHLHTWWNGYNPERWQKSDGDERAEHRMSTYCLWEYKCHSHFERHGCFMLLPRGPAHISLVLFTPRMLILQQSSHRSLHVHF